jgi:hypothetical protein
MAATHYNSLQSNDLGSKGGRDMIKFWIILKLVSLLLCVGHSLRFVSSCEGGLTRGLFSEHLMSLDTLEIHAAFRENVITKSERPGMTANRTITD